MSRKAIIAILAFGSCLALSPASFGAVSPQQAATLKTTLTPMGAERAGSKDGVIPAWTGGLTTVPPGYKSGDKRPDPFAGEKPLFTITSQNMSKYADKLAEGAKFMLSHYPGYRIDVYPTHRTAAAPQSVYDATYRNATRAKTIDNGLGIAGAHGGIPFPIPKDGFEAIFNHELAFRGVSVYEPFRNYMVTADGKITLLAQGDEYWQYPYYFNDMPENKWNDCMYADLRQSLNAPAFRVGESLLVLEPANAETGRKSWQYLTGQRRIRRAPLVEYDTPDFVASGQQYFDEAFVFQGALDRYVWKLIGKKEMYIPYNCNKFYLAGDKDILGEGHNYENPGLVRWELHRVWVVEGDLAPGKRHVVTKRRLYIDEDSWLGVLVDEWDAQGRLWRYVMSFPVATPDLPAVIARTFAVHNLQTGVRTLSVVLNDMPVQDQNKPRWPETFFTPEALAGSSER
jgi:hypothetical protein